MIGTTVFLSLEDNQPRKTMYVVLKLASTTKLSWDGEIIVSPKLAETLHKAESLPAANDNHDFA